MAFTTRAVSALVFSCLGAVASAQVVATIPGFAVTYPTGLIGGKSEVGIPAQFIPIPPATEYYLDYEVAFDSGWAWVKGGKLPGLVGGSHTSGCAAITPDGWSARFMWRTGGQGEVYLYDQNRKNSCGERFGANQQRRAEAAARGHGNSGPNGAGGRPGRRPSQTAAGPGRRAEGRAGSRQGALRRMRVPCPKGSLKL